MRVLSRLGQGGVAETFRALADDGRELALKRLLPHLSTRPDYQDVLAREATIMARLEHPHLPRLAFFGVHQQVPALAYLLVPGQDLRSLLDGLPALPAPTAMGISTSMTRASFSTSSHAPTKAVRRPG